jgi:hypothetical protein
MSDPYKVYKPEELEGLSEQDIRTLKDELEKHVKDSEEARQIIQRYNDLVERLKGGVSNTLNQLKSK